MEIITRARQAGKTTALIELASEKQLYIICPDRAQVRFIADLARKLNKKIPFPLTWQEFVERRYYGQGVKGFAIDNADACLQQLSSIKIEAIITDRFDFTIMWMPTKRHELSEICWTMPIYKPHKQPSVEEYLTWRMSQ